MRILIGAIVAIALAGCATAPQHPAMRPLTQEHIDTIGATRVVLSENNNGIEKAWFYTSTASAGAAYGLIGAIVSATMDAIINYGPSRRAQRAADEMAELMPAEALNASLLEHLRRKVPGAEPPPQQTAELVALVEGAASPAEATEAAAVAVVEPPPPPTGVYYSDVQTEQRLMSRTPLDDAVDIAVAYTLSEDASTLRIIATVTYQNAATPYATRYQFEGAPPRTEREGPLYRNTFTYYSRQLEVPTLTPELRERLIQSIQNSARDENGQLPAADTTEYRGMQRELENAQDDRLTKDEIAIFLTREWLRDNGALLRQEIEQAHEYIARYVALDMNRTAVPSLTGQDELIETMADQRTVRRIGAGVEAGSYVSSPANVTSFSTYGNVIGIARRHTERINAIRAAARPTR